MDGFSTYVVPLVKPAYLLPQDLVQESTVIVSLVVMEGQESSRAG